MLERSIRGIKRSLRDHRWLLYYIQRDLTLNSRYRQNIAAMIARALPHSRPFDPSDESRAIAKRLEEDGIAFIPNLLPASQVNDINSYLRTKTCYDPRHPEESGFQDPADAHSTCFHAYYLASDVVHAPHLLDIANHPAVLESVEIVFGCKPTLASIYVWWSLASYDYSDSERDYFCQNAIHLHRDVDDWAQIKLYIYFSDVDEQAAPHIYLQGSHHSGPGEGKRNLLLNDVRHSCPERLKTVTGPAGTAWLENAFGLHVGTLPEKKNRLLATICYGLVAQPFDTARRNLSRDDSCRYDHFINRLWIGEAKGTGSILS